MDFPGLLVQRQSQRRDELVAAIAIRFQFG